MHDKGLTWKESALTPQWKPRMSASFPQRQVHAIKLQVIALQHSAKAN